ncbi:MAG: thioesterase family protein [Nitriliruptorales bacterium]|nr:thioesterase family protein [Nitriliruptorales bacterium]
MADTPPRSADFAADTAVEPAGGGRYTATVTERWNVLGDTAPNGGYLMAIAGRAMALTVDRPDPVAVTAHYLRPATVGAAEVVTEIVKEGRRLATVQAALRQDGEEKVRLLGAFGDLAALEGPTHDHRPAPDLPPREELIDANAAADERGGFAPQILRRFDIHLPPEMMGWTVGRPLGRGEISGYCRFAGGEPMTTIGLLALADAFPPAVFNMGVEVGWTPTVELTVQIRKRPAPGFLRTRFTTNSVTDGLLEEDGELWDSEGDLVALSRQTALVHRPS